MAQLEILPLAATDPLQIIALQLPSGLLLSHQILEEAVSLLLKRSLVIVAVVAFQALETLLNRFPDEAGWKSVRGLEFRECQQSYASRAKEGNELPTSVGISCNEKE